jgi:hypothetical protein
MGLGTRWRSAGEIDAAAVAQETAMAQEAVAAREAVK